MKKLLAVLVVLSVMVLLLGFGMAEENEPESVISGSWRYYVQEDGTAVITKYSGDNEYVIVPAELDGKIVAGIGYKAFDSRKTMITIIIPDSVACIGGNPFTSCYKLTNIEVSLDNPYLAVMDGVLFSKPDKRLVCCPRGLQLREYTVPKGIKIIGDSAFDLCTELQSVSIPDGVESIGDYAFHTCDLKSIALPDSVTSIGNGAFCGCNFIESIALPDSVTSIGDEMFNVCSSLKTITIPHGVTSIGKNAFADCRSLTSIILPDGVTCIGDYAFARCESLIAIALPDSITNIGANPFDYCVKLADIQFSPDHAYLEVIDGVLFSKPDKRLIYYPVAFTANEYKVPEDTKVIGASAFSRCEYLTSIMLPDSVTSIEDYAFYMCSSLTTITIPDSVTYIGELVFMKCPLLTVSVSRDSYAGQYCKKNGFEYIYPDANDWLNE